MKTKKGFFDRLFDSLCLIFSLTTEGQQKEQQAEIRRKEKELEEKLKEEQGRKA